MTISSSRAAVALAIIAVQAIAASYAYRAGIIPAAPDLAAWGASVGAWGRVRDLPVPASTVAELHADRVMDRVYQRPDSAIQLELFVAWFQAQRGAAQPHSPQVCLPERDGCRWRIRRSRSTHSWVRFRSIYTQ